MYDIFLRTPDLATYRINLKLTRNKKNEEVLDPTGITAANNISRLDATAGSPEQKDVLKYLEYLHGFMATREIGDKQAYAGFIDELEHEMALGVWLFSLPSLAYFNTQFDQNTIHLYGVASQLSTIEKWKERIEE